ncbi:MAG: PhoH family protein [Elusimicrobia bacterium]|nr:PhoH family protein [Elusimicrobiota bacterium]
MDYLSGHHQPQEAGSEPARENEDSRACPQAVFTTYFNRGIVPKTGNQNKYVEAMESNDIVVAIGPAGTGKTFLAVAYALKCLNDKKVSRIVLSRPVVEAGEKLGFLPGDLYEKLYPYLKPLYDAFFAMLGPEKFKSMQVTETIEIVPLAYMRGRTLEDAFIILDEAQNTTQNQMKMFLTRMGQGSRIVVTGDITQVDLENKKLSGLEISEQILAGIDNVVFIRLDETDVVRHPLVKRVIRAYDDWEKRPAPQPHSGGLGRLESQGDATSLGDGNMARGHGRPASIP